MADAAEAPKKKGSMLKKVLIGLVAVVGIFLVVVAMQPSEYQVTRSTTVAASPSAVFPLVNELHAWDKWSPWEKLDPAMKKTFEGPASGVGAVYGWAGNSEVGEGKMTIVESKPAELVRIKLEFFKPMAGESDTRFTFKPEGAGTAVTWAMSGKNNFVGKAMCMIMNMDKMLGGQFEKGLADLKAQAEKK